jgi:lysophospholipase L1-like esterase
MLTTVFHASLLAQVETNKSDLPKVLIIGDSISMAFTRHVARQLDGKAEVVHHKGNAKHTNEGLAKLDQWIGKTRWDVIHFNWGLWDLCYRHPESKVQGRRDKVNGTLTTTLEQYEKNLDELVSRLKKTEAKLIWANTTVVPEKEAGRILGDELKYNEAAARVMKKHGIMTNDLHKLTKTFAADQFDGSGNVHYTQEGYRRIGKQVADQILKALESEQEESLEKP